MDSGRRALVIEDEYLIAMELAGILEELGYARCLIATTEEEAVALAAAERPDLITADVQLREGDGITAVRRITAEIPVPVVYVSSSKATLRERVPDAVQVIKPFVPSDVAQAVEHALGEWKLVDAVA